MDVTSLQPPRYHSGGLGEHCYFRAELRAMLPGEAAMATEGGRAGDKGATTAPHAEKTDVKQLSAVGGVPTDKARRRGKLKAPPMREIGGFRGVLWSPNCGNATAAGGALNVALVGRPVRWKVVLAKAARYALNSMVLSAMQLSLLVKQLEYSATPAAAAKLSILAIGHQVRRKAQRGAATSAQRKIFMLVQLPPTYPQHASVRTRIPYHALLAAPHHLTRAGTA